MDMYPPILMNNGDNFGGFGADIEWDAQGELYIRYDGILPFYKRFCFSKKAL